MFHINVNSAGKAPVGKQMYIFIMYLQASDCMSLNKDRHDLKACAVYVHMIYFKLGRLIKHEVKRGLSLAGSAKWRRAYS